MRSKVNARSNYWRVACTTETNLYDLRLTIPLADIPNGKVGNDRQIFRTVGKWPFICGERFWDAALLFEPRTYVKAKCREHEKR